MQELQVQALGWEDPLEAASATHSSICNWEVPWAEETGGPQPTGPQQSDTLSARHTEGVAGQVPPAGNRTVRGMLPRHQKNSETQLPVFGLTAPHASAPSLFKWNGLLKCFKYFPFTVSMISTASRRQWCNTAGERRWLLNSLEGLMPKRKRQYSGHLTQRANSLEKTLMLGKTEGRRRGDNRGWDGWMASPT